MNKPSGLLVHRSMIDRHETAFAMQMVRDHIGQHVYPVHRLDKPTSGVLLFALSREVAREMMTIFSEGTVTKEYVAVVRGYTAMEACIDYPLKEVLDKMTDKKARTDKDPQRAVTSYRRLATQELPYPVSRYLTARYSLVHCRPETGRKHQLRRHMKHVMHPIVGDTKYGRGEHNQLFRERFDCHRLLLHAARLTLPHPISGESLTFEAGLDDVFQRIVTQFGWDHAMGKGIHASSL